MEHPKEIVIMAIGSLTNIALALKVNPRIAENVKDLVIMGGAVWVPGNISPVAEANFFHDPDAAKLVLHTKWLKLPTLVPLDITNKVRISHDFFKPLENTKLGKILYQMLKFYSDFYRTFNSDMIIHDATAVMVLLHPEYFQHEQCSIEVETAGEVTRGMCVRFVREYNIFPQISKAFNAQVINNASEENIKKIKEKLLEYLLTFP